ncbi:MAG: lysozyme inhibitor LprI family protein, partial [Pseudobdellovibrio sp.]
MKKMIAVLAVLLPLTTFADVKADIAKVDKDLETCLASDDGQSNLGMKECTGAAYDSADKILNQLYKAKVDELSKPTGSKDGDAYNKEILNRLKTSQRAWIIFRDSNSSLAS